MNISGSGKIAAGEYNEKISLSGSGKIDGNVRCIALRCSGSVKAEGSVTCSEEVEVSGSCNIVQGVMAQAVSASGSLGIGGDMTVEDKIKTSGFLDCDGNIKCATLICSGSVYAERGIAAEEIRISGRVKCAGLMNAEKIEIDMSGASMTSTVGSIGGSEIKVYNSKGTKAISRMPLLKHIVGGNGRLRVDELIEGDVIALENVTVPKVVGRIIAIGAGCEVDMVQYSEKIEIYPDSKVGKCEKI